MLDTVGLKKAEDRNNQFLVEKIIHGAEFESFYRSPTEKKPEIMETIEANYRIARRVYQQLHLDISELFVEFIRSLSIYELEDMNKDICANGWGTKKVTEVNDSEELMNIFQNFYSLTGRLSLSNGLLIVTNGDTPPGKYKINMKQLFDLFKNTKSLGLVSLPFLRLIQNYIEKTDDHSLIKNATTEFYGNLSYMTLNGARDSQFEAVSDLKARLSFLLRQATLQNLKVRETEGQVAAKKINSDRLFIPKVEDSLDDVIEMIDDPDVEHKKTMFPYIPPQVQTADDIETTQKLIDNDFIDLQTKFDEPNDVATEQKKQKKIDDTIESVIDDKNLFNTFDDF